MSRNKVCPKCETNKPLDEFVKNRRSKDGRGSYCRPCANENARKARARHPETARNYYRANRERILQTQRKYLQSPEGRATRRANQDAYNEANIELVREWKTAWRKRNPNYHGDWEAANRELARAYKRKAEGKRRARKKQAFVEDVCPKQVFERDKGICGICGSPVDPSDWHLDHIVPLALGGPHSEANVQVSHPRCNLSKGSRLAA